jgi:hypothetical protein
MAKRNKHREFERLQAAIEDDAMTMADEALIKEGDPADVRQLFTAALKRFGYGPTGAKAAPARPAAQANYYAGVRPVMRAPKGQGSGVQATFGPAKDSGGEFPKGPKLRPRKR